MYVQFEVPAMMCDFEYSNHQLFPLYPFRQCPACDQSSGMPLKIRFSCRISKDSHLKSFKPNLPLKSEFFTHPKLPEEFFLIKRQLRGGNKTGIPDIVGVDNLNSETLRTTYCHIAKNVKSHPLNLLGGLFQEI